MKRSITYKIIVSYLLIIIASMVFVGVVFDYATKAWMERQTARSLFDDAYSIADIYQRNSGNADVPVQNKMRQLRDVIRRGIGTLDSRYIILTKDLKQYYPRETEEFNIMRQQIMPQLKENGAKTRDSSTRLQYKNTEYIIAIHPITAASGGLKGWVIAYAPITSIRQMGRGMLFVLLLSMIFTSLLAVAFGIFFARSIAKPIIKLKKRAELLTKRDFDTPVDIQTGDELEDLANTMNKMARELKEYDIAQKRFLQNASHELKTPLMSIQGYAEGIKDGVFENNDQALEIIVEESTRLKKIVDELIFLSKLETMEGFYKFSSEGMNEIIEKSIDKVNSLAVRDNININRMLYKDAVLNVDKDKITQALINILGNCLRHAKNEINITTSNNGEWFEIKVNDDGEGFDEKELKNVFERFYKGKKGNTGLGLAITKVIIEKHRGIITAGNGANGGAEFAIRLPVK